MKRFPHYLPLHQSSDDSPNMSVLTRTYLVIIVIGFAVALSLLYYVSSHMTTPQHRRNLHMAPEYPRSAAESYFDIYGSTKCQTSVETPTKDDKAACIGLVRKHTGSQLNLLEGPDLSNVTSKSDTPTADNNSHQIRILDLEDSEKIPYNTTTLDLTQTAESVPNDEENDADNGTIREEQAEEKEKDKEDVVIATDKEKGVTTVKNQCRPHHASSTIVNTHPQFRKDYPLFVTNNYKSYSSVMNFSPPFGLKGTDKDLTSVLQVLPETSTMPDAIERIQCKRCIVVGSGGILKGKKLGPQIDDFDIVIRLNNAPVNGFQNDVGHKTTIRMSYPEGALQDPHGYDPGSLFLMVPFKSVDFQWLQRIIEKQSLTGITSRFWKSIARSVPKAADKFRIVNPALLQETAFDLIGFPVNGGKMGKNVPTLGSVAIIWAINYCDEVSVAGFGYDLSQPSVLLHYFESTKMSAIKNSWTHNIDKEKQFLKSLVKNGVIADLTGGILGHV